MEERQDLINHPNHLNYQVISKMKSCKELFNKKTNDYGNAWSKQGDIIKAMLPSAIKCETATDISEFQLFGRIVEKLARYATIKFGNNTQKVKTEALAETLEDVSIQALMLATLYEKNNVDF